MSGVNNSERSGQRASTNKPVDTSKQRSLPAAGAWSWCRQELVLTLAPPAVLPFSLPVDCSDGAGTPGREEFDVAVATDDGRYSTSFHAAKLSPNC